VKNFSGLRSHIDRIANFALIPVAAPFAVAAILTTQPSFYTVSMQYHFDR
jgi:hypothetical protein